MTRFEGSIQLSSIGYGESDFGKITSAIIGRGGSGIKALTAKFPGLFVKIYDSRRGVGVRCPARDCDTIHISARESSNVQDTAQEIGRIARSAMDGTLKRGPELQVSCPSDAVGSVIGRGGSGLHRIQEMAGDNCHIHYNREKGHFEISATTTDACSRAKIYVGNAIKDFYKPRTELPEYRSRSNTAFDALTIDEDVHGGPSDDELETAVDQKKRAVQRIIQVGQNALERGSYNSAGSIHSRKSQEVPAKERWAIREELQKKTDPKTGEPLYTEFSRMDRKTGNRQWVTGVQVVPWKAVDDVIAQRQARQEKLMGERQAKRNQEQIEKSSWEARQTYQVERSSKQAFPCLGSSASKTRTTCWGSKPSSINSAEGVVELNEVESKKPRFVSLRRKTRTKAQTAPETFVDLDDYLLSAPKTQTMDLTSSLLPTGPKLSKPVQPTPFGSQVEEDYWLQVHLDQGGTEEQFYLQHYPNEGVDQSDETYTAGDEWWNNE